MEPSEKVVQQLPSKQLLQNYGRTSKLLIAAKGIPNLQFKVGKTEDTSKIREYSNNSPEGAGEIMEVMESDVLSQNVRRRDKDSLQISENCEYSVNLLNSAAGAAHLQVDTEEITEIMFNTNLQQKDSEACEHLINLLSSAAGPALQQATPDGMRKITFHKNLQDINSETHEHSINSLSSEACVVVRPTTTETNDIVEDKWQQKKKTSKGS